MANSISVDEMKKIDRSNTLDVLLSFPDMVRKAYDLPRPQLRIPKPESILVLGMGGSAIGGDLLSAWMMEKKGPQVLVNRDYDIPSYIGPKTLVFAVSYSGNTEETLSAYEQAKKRGCTIVTVSSGGKLAEMGDKKTHVALPKGLQPRAAVAYMLMPVLGVLQDMGVMSSKAEVDEAEEMLRGLMREIGPGTQPPANPAMSLAFDFKDTFPMIFSGPFLAPVAKRWRTQLNENSKILAREDVLPELDHNDLVAWAEDPMASKCTVVLLRDSLEHPRVSKRMGLTRKLGWDRAKAVREVHTKGKGALARLLTALVVGDFASFYLAMLRGADPTPVQVIERLKKELAG